MFNQMLKEAIESILQGILKESHIHKFILPIKTSERQ